MGKPSEPSDDVDLALRLMDDEQSALAEILRWYGPAVAAGLRGKYETLTYEDVEDVLSIAISRLWDARHVYDENRSTLRTYFYGIADNAARDVFEFGWHRARRLEVDYGGAQELDAVAPTSVSANDRQNGSPSECKKRSQKAERGLGDLKQIVEGLPEKQRHIIQADACTKDEVADAGRLADELGIAATSVRVYRMRAMETIRRRMRERGHHVS